MREKIYTIPVNEAFDNPGECPLCRLLQRLEGEAVDYALGGAMMEPDYRIISNEKGYCNTHFSRMLKKKEKLSLALVLDTHFDHLIAALDEVHREIELTDKGKKHLFGKKTPIEPKTLYAIEDSCVICDKLTHTMDRYLEVIFHLWKKEEEFTSKLEKSKGFCLPHFNRLVAKSEKLLSAKDRIQFLKDLCGLEKRELERIQGEVHKFTLKFDYRSRGEAWGSEIDAPKRAAEKLSSYINFED